MDDLSRLFEFMDDHATKKWMTIQKKLDKDRNISQIFSILANRTKIVKNLIKKAQVVLAKKLDGRKRVS